MQSDQSRLEFSAQRDYDRAVSAACAQLDAPSFAAAYEAGRTLTLEQAIAEAEQVAASPSTHQPTTQPTNEPTTPFPAGLTAREVEVLRLLARGLTDAEIASTLIISPRTVNSHLRTIFSKLDVTTRTAAARVAMEYGLV